MRALDPSSALDQGGCLDAERTERMEARTGGYDIGDRIRGADFVKSDVVHRDTMDGGLRHSDPLKNRDGTRFHFRVQHGLLEERPDFTPGAAVDVQAMGVVVAVTVGMPRFAVAVRMHVEFPSGNSLPEAPLEMEMHLVAQPERGDGLAKNLLADAKVAQGADSHISGNSGKTIEVENSHGNFRARF
jgi:hypothetical protein